MLKIQVSSRHFPEEFRRFLALREEGTHSVRAQVEPIIAQVRAEGDAALLDLTRRFDDKHVQLEDLRVSPETLARAVALTSPEVMRSLKLAAQRIRAYSERQLPENTHWVDDAGTTLGWRWTPLDAVGLYVPGGKAAYPSSVLMNAVPAMVAGVQRLVMCVPAPEGRVESAVLAAAHVAGVHEVWRVGGAQAIAAMAYGTESMAPVDKIVGPGNAYVAEAKRQVFGQVGIDMIAGPSEILVIADNSANPRWIAADLLSQAEHDEMAQAVLITDSASFATRVEQAVAEMLDTLPRAAIARVSWERFGAIFLVREPAEAADIANVLAPEHVELAVETPKHWLPLLRHAGAIFLGHYTPEAVGDYIAGPSHVLPTSRTARFASGLSVLDFMKRTSLIGCTPQALRALGPQAEVLAETEGLHAHGHSLLLRRS